MFRVAQGREISFRSMAELAIILPASGNSTRYGGANKLLERLGGSTVLERSIKVFADCAAVAEIFVATNNSEVIAALSAISNRVVKPVRRCEGGQTRAHSVLGALRQVSQE